MRLRKVFVGSVSVLALASIAAPVYAQDNMETVVVTGIRASMQRAMDIKRDTTAIVDAVSAEDIGKFPDKNVADALQRVPGVNTVSAASGEGGFDENDRVSIRGTNASLTQTTINGHGVSTGDWFILDQYQTIGRSVSYSLFPAEIVASAKVYKSQQADLVEGGVAGAVDIITRKPLDFKDNFTIEASGEAAYTTLRGDTTPQLNTLLAWKNDTNTFGVMAQAFYEARNIRRDGQEFLGYSQFVPYVAAHNDANGNPVAASGDLATKGHPDLNNVYYPTLIGSAYFEQERIRQGGDIALQFKPSNAIEINFDAFYSHMGASNKNNNYMFWGAKEFPGPTGNVPTAYKVVNNVLVAATLPMAPGLSPIVADFIMRPHSMSDSYYFNGDLTYNPNDNLAIKVKAGYTRGAGTTPQQAAWEGTTAAAPASYDFSSGVAAVGVTGINLSSPATLTNDWAWGAVSKASDHEVYAQVDVEQQLAIGPFKSVEAGVRYVDHKHKSDIWDGGVSYGSGPGATGDSVSSTNYPSDFADSFKIPGMLTNVPMGDMSKIVNVLNNNASWRSYPQSAAGVTRASRYMWSGSTDVKEQDTAGYVMANVGGDRWKGNFGVRIVNSAVTIIQPVNGTPSANGTTCPTTGDLYSDFGCFHYNQIDKEYWDVLPSANLSFNLTEDSLLRFAAAETMARPDYSALGGAVNLTDLTHVGSGGNPNLKPVRSANYDLSYEWYYGPQAMVSVSVFYMDLSSYVTNGVTQGTYLDMLKTGQGTPVYSSYAITAPYNTSGHNEGFEVAWEQPIYGGFGVNANYAYVNGAETGGGTLVGNTKNTVNLSGYYENDWVSARVSYNYASGMLVGLDRSSAEYQNAYGRVDASVNFTVTDNFTLTFNGLNLTNQTLKYYANNSTMPRALYSNGSQLYAGVRFKY
ncbi:MAG: TonB-dependent receptor [Rhizomicrobium sp.]|nr:TonB-dependent receptor [Rhizomicrobium sp.]